MPRPPGALLLLMTLTIATTFATTFATATATRPAAPPPPPVPVPPAAPPLDTINPWLSACDLQPDSVAAELRGGAGGACVASSAMQQSPRGQQHHHGRLCPPPCSGSSTQCLYYLEESHKETVCGASSGGNGGLHGGGGGGGSGGGGTGGTSSTSGASNSTSWQWREALRRLRMRHCCEHSVLSALPRPLRDRDDCRLMLDALLEVDALARRITCEFDQILTRYDCSQKYSIKHECQDCKDAYRQWVCSSMVPHIISGRRVRPCLSICQSVEQKCPYMLPGDRAPAHPTQYAGEPTFLCRDPIIEETGEQRARSSVGDEDCCYTHCGTPGRGGGGAESDICVRRRNSTTTTATAATTNCSNHRDGDGDHDDGGGGGHGNGHPQHLDDDDHHDDGGGELPEPVRCGATGLGGVPPGCRLSSAASSSSARTLSQVSASFWTAWITFLMQLVHTVYNLMQCLWVECVECATGVRTSLFVFVKTKWRRRPWS